MEHSIYGSQHLRLIVYSSTYFIGNLTIMGNPYIIIISVSEYEITLGENVYMGYSVSLA